MFTGRAQRAGVRVRALRSQQGFYLATSDTAARGRYLPLQGDVLETRPVSLNKCSAKTCTRPSCVLSKVCLASQVDEPQPRNGSVVTGKKKTSVCVRVRQRARNRALTRRRGFFCQCCHAHTVESSHDDALLVCPPLQLCLACVYVCARVSVYTRCCNQSSSTL